MTRYGFECPACGHAFDAWRYMSDTQPELCPECGSEAKRTLSTGVGAKTSVESSARYNQWYHSDRTQKRIKAGELAPVGKDHDIRHI